MFVCLCVRVCICVGSAENGMEEVGPKRFRLSCLARIPV